MYNIRWYHVLFSSLAIFLVIAFFYYVREILPPFIIALIIAWLLDPLIDRLESRGWPRIFGVIFVFTLFLSVFAVGLFFLIPSVIDQAKQLASDFPDYLIKSREYLTDLFKSYQPILLRFKLPTTFHDFFTTFEKQLNSGLTFAVKVLAGWITSNLSKVLWIVIIPIVSFYYLNDIDKIKIKLKFLIPEKWRFRTTSIIGRVSGVFTSYMRGLLIVCLIYGVSTGVLLSVTSVKYSILIGLIAGLFYAVPYIGTLFTAILAFLVALATHNSASHFPIWLPPAIILLMNQIFDLFISPKVLGKSVGLHPVLSLFAMIAGGQLFGFVGMILAVPLGASVQEIIFEIFPILKKPINELTEIKRVDETDKQKNSELENETITSNNDAGNYA